MAEQENHNLKVVGSNPDFGKKNLNIFSMVSHWNPALTTMRYTSNCLPWEIFTNFKVLLSYFLTGSETVINSTRKENCDSRDW